MLFSFGRIVFGRDFRKYMIFIVKSSGLLIISILIRNACKMPKVWYYMFLN